MDITAFIRELLFSHDCVILPGFGGFIGNYSPARVDKATCTFYPPVKLISFNRNLNHNDGLLIGKISSSAGIHYGEAKNLVEEFVAEIKKSLSKGEKVIFEKIGTFQNNSEGNVQFEPDREVNYHLNSYGLTSFHFPLIEGYDVRRRLLKEPSEESTGSTGSRKYLWRAAVIIPLIGALIAVPLITDIFKTRVQATSMNPLVLSTSDSSRNEKPAVKKEEGTTTKTPANNTAINTQPSEQNIKPEIFSPNLSDISSEEYCVITGSFKSESNASVLKKKLEGEGYSPEIISGPNGFYRVSAVRCRTLSEANTIKEKLETRYSGAWVTRIK